MFCDNAYNVSVELLAEQVLVQNHFTTVKCDNRPITYDEDMEAIKEFQKSCHDTCSLANRHEYTK